MFKRGPRSASGPPKTFEEVRPTIRPTISISSLATQQSDDLNRANGDLFSFSALSSVDYIFMTSCKPRLFPPQKPTEVRSISITFSNFLEDRHKLDGNATSKEGSRSALIQALKSIVGPGLETREEPKSQTSTGIGIKIESGTGIRIDRQIRVVIKAWFVVESRA
ncbi:hypothetical protein EVAR_40836_1 [Eumeta japonica]|uniref:Uncharacterized protein n=1 Tax=Eumeta variegata TaxID=151549 RepID=A0A4C1WJJ5_EUMVA|nr:hypothetical protein EVAR_40836_1 [Eumeta japonica]